MSGEYVFLDPRIYLLNRTPRKPCPLPRKKKCIKNVERASKGDLHPYDLDLEQLIQDMHDGVSIDRLPLIMRGEQDSLLIGKSNLSSSSASLSSEENRLNGSTNSISEADMCRDKGMQGMAIQSQSEDVSGVNLPKSMSLPLDQVIPEPFPEISHSPVTPTLNVLRNETTCRSSPSSPLVRRSKTKSPLASPPGSGNTSPEEPPRWKPQHYTKLMLLFYHDDYNYKSLMVDDTMRASDICHLLSLKNQAVDDKNWAVVEHLAKFNIERCLEDHELVHEVNSLWPAADDNRFYFKKDFRKYAVFQNPAQLFPMKMLDTKGDLSETKSERQRNFILQNLFSCTEQLPDVQGFMHMRTGKKWKKYFFVLRSSGLYYSSKGTSKEPRYLTMVSNFEDVQINSMHNTKKNLHAPNNHCICLKPNRADVDWKDLQLFCPEDEVEKNCWLAACRLVKYGPQLRENYKEAVKRETKLKNIENRKNESIYSKARVAMDFTGQSGKVVIDPNEALGVAIEEAQNWRKRVCNRGAVKTPLSQSPTVDGPSVGTQAHGISSGIHMTQPWFHSGISRKEAVELISKQGLIDGVFLVRESHHIPGSFVLSLAHNGKVLHCQIIRMEEEERCFLSPDGGHTKFTDLIQLVEFYQLNTGGLPCRLTNYVTSVM